MQPCISCKPIFDVMHAAVCAQGHFSEKDAAEKLQCLLDFIAFAHSKNIIHRDLKPENILLSDKTPTAALKVIDFGTSDFCASGQRLQQKFGTPYYVSRTGIQGCCMFRCLDMSHSGI